MQVEDLDKLSFDELQALSRPLDSYINTHEVEFIGAQGSTIGATLANLAYIRMAQVRQLLIRIEELERACGGNWRKEQ